MTSYVNKYKNENGFTIYYIEETSCCKGKVEWARGDGPEVCPHCSDKYYRKPNLENKLFNLQDAFLADFNRTGNTQILGERMFPLIQEYAVNLIKAMIKGKKSLSVEELEMRSWDAATLLIEVIMKDPDHSMRHSFGKYLKNLCKSVCYSTKNHEHNVSLNQILSSGEKELGETVTVNLNQAQEDQEESDASTIVKMNNSTEMPEFKEDITDKLLWMVKRTADVLFTTTKNYAVKLLYLQGLLIKFQLSDDRILSGFFGETGATIKRYVEKGELIIFKELRSLVG